MTNAKKRIIVALIVVIGLMTIAVFGVSAYVSTSASDNIVGTYDGGEISGEDIEKCREANPQCILVLGCAVWDNNQPSPMLQDRLDTAIALYEAGVAPKLLLSGDNSRKEYSEPDCMLQYALEQGVPTEDIFLDFAGFSTYDSIYRAKAIFKVNRAIVVTQKYHLFRALRICEALGIDGKGFAANQRQYVGRYNREAREVLARDKDFIKSIIKPEPTFLGEEIPIDGDGSVTHLN